MSPCEGTDRVTSMQKVHLLCLSGVFLGRLPVLVRAQIGFNQQYGCLLKVHCRTLAPAVAAAVLECIN